MSFILDALKKSEADRQQQAGGEFSNVPSSSGEPQSFRWLWILAFLLLVNFAVLLGILMRDDEATPAGEATQPAQQASGAETPAQQARAGSSFEEKVAAARQNQPPPVAVPDEQPAEPVVTAAPVVAAPPASNVTTAPLLPTFDELRIDGTLQMTDLHLDIHVFAEDPAERFVFINMNKQRENSKLDEGPVVREITPDGVILEHQGSTFLLPRE